MALTFSTSGCVSVCVLLCDGLVPPPCLTPSIPKIDSYLYSDSYFSPHLWDALEFICISNMSSICLSLHCSDILRVGVTLAGHQKKILNSVQMMRAQMNQIQSVEVWPSCLGALRLTPSSTSSLAPEFSCSPSRGDAPSREDPQEGLQHSKHPPKPPACSRLDGVGQWCLEACLFTVLLQWCWF